MGRCREGLLARVFILASLYAFAFSESPFRLHGTAVGFHRSRGPQMGANVNAVTLHLVYRTPRWKRFVLCMSAFGISTSEIVLLCVCITSLSTYECAFNCLWLLL
ncbi:unnamed protein product [Ixodes persulcatus]